MQEHSLQITSDPVALVLRRAYLHNVQVVLLYYLLA
jgi:hypothetical protein